MSKVTLEKDGNKKILKAKSKLISILKAEGWKEIKKKVAKKEIATD